MRPIQRYRRTLGTLSLACVGGALWCGLVLGEPEQCVLWMVAGVVLAFLRPEKQTGGLTWRRRH